MDVPPGPRTHLERLAFALLYPQLVVRVEHLRHIGIKQELDALRIAVDPGEA